MNQILYVQDKRNNNNPIDIKKIILFFAISLIIVGLILLGKTLYLLYINKEDSIVAPNPQEESKQEFIPTILLTKTEDNKVILNVTSEIEISHIIYNWNNEASQTLEETGKTNVEEIINIPTGENTLNLSIIDKNGKETTKQENFVVEETKPEIELSIVGNDIKVNVTSKVDLSYVTYKWNSEQENKEDMFTYEDKTKFQKSIEIPKGQNTLQIIAVDKNDNKTEKSQDIKGVTKAKTTVLAEGKYLNFTVTGEENIKTVEFIFNSKKYLMNTETFGETKIVKYKIELVDGMNYLKIISTTQSEAVDTSVWKYEYKAQ